MNIPKISHRTLGTLLIGASLTIVAGAARAIDIDAGDYTALPEGTNVGLLYMQHAKRNSLYANGQQVPGNNGLDSDIGILRLIHFTKIGGYVVDPQLLLPFGHLKATGALGPVLGKGSGTGDLILAATVWTINEPENKRYLGITPFLFAPTGTYDAAKALNLGENRWKYALQVGYIQGVGDKLTFDLAADVTAYGHNDRANPAGQTLTQAPSYQVQGFMRYALSPGWDLRAGLSRTRTGETKLDGNSRADASTIDKLQLGTAVFLTPKTQLLATWGRDLSVSNGFKEASRVNLRLLQVF
ncbi:transporter [Polaromonas sp. JS666]|uniref:transporter n=1 Tax=Polaromonas sp. (strain JS666 / ATCC BAA-500) TaxID=296591 RepID=UPI0000464905|nr:transporter [Polaromonas sp. JS666]ABE46406.1 conserved hypothetical protein; putative signal peptide [Polaromonas sp. JS666]UUZ72041.1 transporter [Polaromonas sp. P1(28)-8]